MSSAHIVFEGGNTDGMGTAGFIFSSDEDAWRRLGRAVAVRRNELAMTHREAARVANNGASFWFDLENERIPNGRIQRRSAAKIESTLGWKPGSVEAILFDGAEPELVEAEVVPANYAEAYKELLVRVESLEKHVAGVDRKLEKFIDALTKL